MSEFIFTPGQKKEALTWLKENCPELLAQSELQYELREEEPDGKRMYMNNYLIDMYFKLKNISFPCLKTEFLVGIEYTDKNKVIDGTEPINIRFQNPHKKGKYDEFAFQVIMELLNRLKG